MTKTHKQAATTLERHPGLFIESNTAKGRGVFTNSHIPASTIIETCPVLILPLSELKTLESTLVYHYTFNWPVPTTEGKVVTTQALALGLGSMFNHARRQNVGFQRDVEREVIVYRTLRDVEADEELCINYGSHLWFKDADIDANEDGVDDELPLEAITIDEE